MLILADNDVGGAVTALRRILESAEWAEFSATLALQFIAFADVGLARDASDRLVWDTCQAQEYARVDSLPVVTIGDPQRVVRDRTYARECAMSLLDLLERLETLRGTGRLFIP
jgi:hypothetical protein